MKGKNVTSLLKIREKYKMVSKCYQIIYTQKL